MPTNSTITVADVLFCLPAIEAKAKKTGGIVRHAGGACPICALAHAVGLAHYTNLNEFAAGAALDVPLVVADTIARAADDPTHPLRAELEAYLSW